MGHTFLVITPQNPYPFHAISARSRIGVGRRYRMALMRPQIYYKPAITAVTTQKRIVGANCMSHCRSPEMAKPKSAQTNPIAVVSGVLTRHQRGQVGAPDRTTLRQAQGDLECETNPKTGRRRRLPRTEFRRSIPAADGGSGLTLFGRRRMSPAKTRVTYEELSVESGEAPRPWPRHSL